ncbi:MAG: hypothetical protein GY804_01405 [Alphaproteobacteria bacterium]|nr:hypothetical protein [Alphaproteobacteria bacterium]
MLDIGWVEFILISAIALIFIRPKDLPEMMEGLGNLAYKIKSTIRIAKNCINEIICDAKIDKNKN